MIPFLTGIPWRLMGIGVAAVAVAALGWKVAEWRNDSHELARIQPAYDSLLAGQEKANEKVEKLAPVDDQARRDLAIARTELQNQRAETSRAWGRVAALEESVNAETGCPVVRLSDDWGLFFSTAATGIAPDDPPSEAPRSDGAVPPG